MARSGLGPLVTHDFTSFSAVLPHHTSLGSLNAYLAVRTGNHVVTGGEPNRVPVFLLRHYLLITPWSI
jgi:hypothetical protein